MSAGEPNSEPAPDVYDEQLNDDTTLDLSSKELEILPEIKNTHLSVLYLQNNKLTSLPENFFETFPNLMYLDLRENLLTELPKTIKDHKCLTHLLLQNNEITRLPNELGVVPNLKVLHLNKNPLEYPPKNIVTLGTAEVLKYLKDQYILEALAQESSTNSLSSKDAEDVKKRNNSLNTNTEASNSCMSIKLNERDFDEEIGRKKRQGRCKKYNKTLYQTPSIPTYYQSAKYLKPVFVASREDQEDRLKELCVQEACKKKQKELLEKREKILQNRKNIESLKNWRQKYRQHRFYSDPTYRMEPENFPFGTLPEYMTVLSREDIEKDLPDKYRKSITRRSRPSVPRKASGTNLALKIKQLFQNLEAIDHTRHQMTPRTEQRALLDEIQKISEIKKKLSELSITNQNTLAIK